RGHFFAVVARTMRHILVDHARAAAATRRGGGAHVVRLSALVDAGEGVALPGSNPLDLLVFDEALTELAELRPRQARVLELRAFGGLSVVEVAELLGVSRQTVVLDTRLGRAWLVARLQRHSG
ncbi:MAG: ECF-type sigma factor, partial [Acidobacteriota bacterium]